MENNNERFHKIKQEEKDNTIINVVFEKKGEKILKYNSIIENQFKKSKKQGKNINRYYHINLISKILFIIFLFIIDLAREIKSILQIERKKIITIGFYDVIYCERKWRRVKRGYFYELPKYTNKFRWVFLAKNGIDPKCNNYTHLKFRKANNYKNLKRAVIENKINIIVQNEDENLKEHKYLLHLKKKYGTKLVQIMHEYYFFFLIEFGVVDYYNYLWKPLKNFDAIISSVPCQIYIYHLQQLNQSIYLPPYLPFDYREIQPSKLDTKNILMVGRISPEKQYELGIKSMSIIIKKFPDAILQIIGGFNEYTESLKKLAKNLKVSNNVIFYESKQDLRPFYRNASLFFMTSSAESFSFVLSESKAYGLANIVTGKEYLVLTKKGSIVVKDNDYKEMAYEAIKLFSNITYLREQGKAARESLIDFISEKVDVRYINLFDSLMNGTSKEFFDSEYNKYINETDSLKELVNSLELVKEKRPQKFHCYKIEDFLKPFESINN